MLFVHRVFVNRDFFLLWQGQLVSQLGNQAFLIATAYVTFERTGSMTSVGSVMMASTLPLALIAPFGGTIADRHSRRTILIATDAVRAIAVSALGLLLLARPDEATFSLMPVIVVALFNGTMAALFTPAVHALVPDLVPPRRLAAANSVSQLSTQASILAGQALGGVVYLQLGAGGLLLLDAMTFAYGAVATWLIRDRHRPGPPAGLRTGVRRYVVEAREGFIYLRGRPGAIVILAVFAGVNFLFMPVVVVLPLYVRDVLNGGPDWFGFLLAASGAGALAGAGLSSLLLPRVNDYRKLLANCVAGIALAVLALATTTRGPVALWIFAAIGTCSSLINVAVITAFQLAVPSEIRGRVMALVVALSTAAVPLGMGLGGIAGDIWRDSVTSVFIASGAALAAASAVALLGPGFGTMPDRPSSPR